MHDCIFVDLETYISFQAYKYAIMQLSEHATIQVWNYKNMQLGKYKGVPWLDWTCPDLTYLVLPISDITFADFTWPDLICPDLTWPQVELNLEVGFKPFRQPLFTL